MSSTPTAERPTAERGRRRRRRWTALAVLLALLVLGAVVGPRIYAAVESRKTAAPLAPAVPSASATPTAAATDPALDGTWTVAPGGTAGYRVDEVLNGQRITVTGRTDQVTGDLVVAGGQLTAATVSVDLASVSTDSSQRDGQFRSRVVDVERFPTADLVLTRPVPLGGLDVGATIPVTLTGTLALRGTTREVTFPATVQRTGEDAVTVTGSLPVTWSDHGVEAPDLGFVSVEDTGTIEFSVSATPA